MLAAPAPNERVEKYFVLVNVYRFHLNEFVWPNGHNEQGFSYKAAKARVVRDTWARHRLEQAK